MAKSSLSIILPTYNEREAICRLIQKILEVVSSMNLNVEIIIVDDSSSDGTAETIKRAFTQIFPVHLIRREGPRSLGASIKEGILASKMEFVLVMDANFNHSPQDIPRLFACKDRTDFVSGSRFIRGAGVEKRKTRFLGTRFFNFLCRRTLGLRVVDILNGFLLAKRKNFLALPLEKIFTGDGDFAIRLHYAIKKKGWSIIEIPVNYSPLRFGVRSKTHFFKYTWRYSLAALKARFLIKK